MSEIQTVISRLEQLGCQPQRSGVGWKSLCPAHSDRNASLSIDESSSGKLLLNCFAGCKFEDILASLGIDKTSTNKPVERVKTPNLDRHTRFDPKAAERLVSRSHGYLLDNPEALAALSDQRGVSLETVRLYGLGFDTSSRRWVFPIYNPAGQLCAVKMHRSQPDQTPKATQPAGSSAGLFRIHAIDRATEVILTEGEFDAACCHSATGLVGVSPSAGCGVWRREWNEVFRDKRVILVPDRDEAGMRFVRLVTENLSGIRQLLVCDAEDYPADCKDCCDIVRVGGAEALQMLISNAVESVPVCEEKTAQIESIAATEHTTELGLSRRFLAQHGEFVRYCYPWKQWLAWDGKKWEQSSRIPTALMIETGQSIYEEALQVQDTAQRVELVKFAKKCEAVTMIDHALELSQPFVAIEPESLDSNGLLLNCQNGVLDLETGKLLPHEPALNQSQITNTVYDAAAKSPTWERCLNQWTCGDAELAFWLQVYSGLCLTGLTTEHIFPVFFGHGCNGKSVFTEALKAALGDYATTLPVEVLSEDRQHPCGVATLYRRRLVTVSESSEVFRLNEGLVKSLCSSDTLTARRMREDFWEFKPTHKICLATNAKPSIAGTDYGVWRRVRLVPWSAQIQTPDRYLPRKLQEELPGILRWAVAGCLEYRKNGLPACSVIERETENYRNQEDCVGRFLSDCCATIPAAQVKPSVLSAAFNDFLRENGILKKINLRSELERRGFEQQRTATGRFWVGIGLSICGESWVQ